MWKIFHRVKNFDISFFSANKLEIEVCRPITHIDEKGQKYTDYEVNMRTNLPIFR